MVEWTNAHNVKGRRSAKAPLSCGRRSPQGLCSLKKGFRISEEGVPVLGVSRTSSLILSLIVDAGCSVVGVSSSSVIVTNKSNALTYTVASSLISTSPLTVTTVVGLLEALAVPNSAELRSFLLTLCMLAPEPTTNSLSSGCIVDAASKTHSSVGEKSVAFSFSLS